MHICQLSTIFFACFQEGSNYWTAKNGASPAPHVLLCDLPRVGTEVVNQLLVTVRDNPDRLGNEAQVTPSSTSSPLPRCTVLVSVQPVTPIPKSRSHAQFDAYRSIVVATKGQGVRSSATPPWTQQPAAKRTPDKLVAAQRKPGCRLIPLALLYWDLVPGEWPPPSEKRHVVGYRFIDAF